MRKRSSKGKQGPEDINEIAFRVMQEATGEASLTPLADELSQALSSEVDAFQNDVEGYSWENHVGPVLSIVEALPKDELAEMAEAVVSLTALRRKMSSDQETVGPPIDVAVISKGDGLVWIKRKHYFDIGLNPYFLARHQ